MLNTVRFVLAATTITAATVALTLSPAYAQIEEITVTAQKREQNLQDVSAPVTAFSQDRLASAGINDVESLQKIAPNITVGDSFGYANLFIRGLGYNTVFANVDPSVTIYTDGAIISQPSAQLFSFFDLERVEVLRGPQGTLYGRNSTGGTINLITARPTEEFSGYARLTGGNNALVQTEGAISGPITENLLGRISFLTTNRNGFGKNEVTGNDVSDRNRQAFRAQLQYHASDDLQLRLIAEYGRENDASNALFFKRETFPDVLNDDDPTNDRLAATGKGGFPTGGPRDYASDVDPSNDRKTWSVTGIVDWAWSDTVSVKNILNYREFDSELVQDLDLSAVRNSSVQDFTFSSQQFSEELQLSVRTDRINAIGGFYYFTEDLFNENAIATGAKTGQFDPTAPGGGRRVFLTGNGDTNSWALFWNVVFDLTPQIAIKGGGRYTEDTRKIDNENFIFVAPTFQLMIPGPDGKRTFTNYTNEAGLEWRPADNILLYYTYSEGFKAGTGQLGTTVGRIVDPESITNHEAGLKTTLADRRLIINLAGYTYHVDNVQLDQTLPGGPTGFITQFRNATSQDGHGIELEAFWTPTDLLRFSGAIAYQKTKFGSFLSVNPANPAQVPEDIAGNRARNAPKWAASVHGEYDIPVSNGGVVTVMGDLLYKGAQFFSEFNDPLLSEDSYTIIDAKIRYVFPNGRWAASVWGKNLADKLVEAANFAVATGKVTGRTFLPPRTYGLTLGYVF